jgi:hypothetical protein
MKNYQILLLVFFMIGSVSCSKKNSTQPEVVSTEDLLIKNNEMSGWERTGEHWYAAAGNLENHIDGEAEVYNIRGLVEASKQEYKGKVQGGNLEYIELRIFDMGKAENAKSVFDELVRQMSNPIDWPDGAGDGVKIDRLPLSQIIDLHQSRYFIHLNISTGDDQPLDVLKQFAVNVSGKIK